MNKVLIVDDEKEIADLVEIYLENDGYQVYKFYNGEDALNCIHNNDIDLAILDIMLPDICLLYTSEYTLCLVKEM